MYDVLYTICYFKNTQGYFNGYDVKILSSNWWNTRPSTLQDTNQRQLDSSQTGRASNFNLTKKPPKMYFLRSVDMLDFNEMVQSSAEILTTFDIILCKTQNSNIYLGGVLIILSMDHNRIHPIWVHKFLTSYHIIFCFEMVTLENCAQDSNDVILKRIHRVTRFKCRRIVNEPDLVDEF